ncbi:MAG TPA: alpha/beta hydrolase [Cellvibrionaceae bacterium]|nr:alpha/beta hydrolase [Cellvibrionaceae bacterium]HMW72559.1 alpha/beta hydrolase [Cellvibrionaceae bacterium]HMY37855.1 alpha/beta hydrolase [Marinagarivorans sp.]HNG58492.1 alpha/beta hydrolase [Cellvibrionaceae bacterium]
MCSWQSVLTALFFTALTSISVCAADKPAAKTPAPTDPAHFIAPKMQVFNLYGEGAIPNSKPVSNEETGADKVWIQKVSQPSIQVYLPAKGKATGASVVIFPGGAYWGLTFDYEGVQQANYFVDHGIAAFVVKYRLPSDTWMIDKTIGPLQDAQQAMLFARQNARQWNLDADRIGAVGFSAGGHLAASLATHFNPPLINNPANINLRPDFLVLVYPVISMDAKVTHLDSRKALLGEKPTKARIEFFSAELQVNSQTPPTLLLHAVDDTLVDIKNSLLFFEALKQKGVPVEAHFLERGEHGFIRIPRDRWQGLILQWLQQKGWLGAVAR